MAAGDRCCQRRHPVWRCSFLWVNVTFILLFKERARLDGNVRTRPNSAKCLKSTDMRSCSDGPRVWETNLKRNLGNQLRSPWEAESFSFSPPSPPRFFPHPLNRDLDLPITAPPCVKRLCQTQLYPVFFFLSFSFFSPPSAGRICCQNVFRVLLKKCHSSFPCNAIHMLVKGGMSKDLNSFAF